MSRLPFDAYSLIVGDLFRTALDDDRAFRVENVHPGKLPTVVLVWRDGFWDPSSYVHTCGVERVYLVSGLDLVLGPIMKVKPDGFFS